VSGLVIEGGRATRGAFALDVDLETRASITALYGPNGSGKTTLLHAVAGLVPFSAGRVQVGSRVLDHPAQGVRLAPRARRVGVVFQDLRLFPHLDVAANVGFGLRGRGAERGVPIAQLVDAFDLRPLLGRYPAALSGGERQRVALARALAPRPELLLLDEPLAAVDAASRRQILPYLKWVREQLAVPMVYVTHRLAEILELTDSIAIMDGGRIVGHGEVFETLERTLHGSVGEGFEVHATLPERVDFPHEDGAWVSAFVGEQRVLLPFRPLSTGTLARVALRPEDVMLAARPLHGVSARNQLRGKVVRVSGLHGRYLVHVEVGADAVVRAEITEDARAELKLDVGREVWCVVKTSAFRWM